MMQDELEVSSPNCDKKAFLRRESRTCQSIKSPSHRLALLRLSMILACTFLLQIVLADLITTKNDLKTRIDTGDFTEIESWDTSNIADLSAIFESKRDFDSPVGAWDTSSVTNLEATFNEAKSFNQVLSSWDTSRATKFMDLFRMAFKFNQPIQSWDTSRVTTLDSSFREALIFNQILSGWDISKVKKLAFTFEEAANFDQDLSAWDTSRATTFKHLFYKATRYNQPVQSWDVSSVTTLEETFRSAESFNQPISEWNVNSVTNMQSMLTGTISFNQPPWCSKSWAESSILKQDYVICCSKGEYYESRKCKHCNRGMIQDAAFTQVESCKQCQRNSISSEQGGKCVECIAGQYSNNGIVCESCPSGYYQENGEESTVCLECRIGMYQPAIGSTSCQQCARGQYQNKKGSQYCLPCMPGQYQPARNQSSCIMCERGKYQDKVGHAECNFTRDGYQAIGGNQALNNPGHMAEISCPAGRYFVEHTCVECPVDTYAPEPASLTCLTCTRGLTRNKTGATLCSLCEAGKSLHRESIGGNTCQDCLAGKISSKGENCIACPPGTYSRADSTTCTVCPKGKWSNQVGAPHMSACKNCSAGFYSYATGLSNESDCASCIPGRYSSEVGITFDCKSCPFGWFQPTSSSAVCVLIEKGHEASLLQEGNTVQIPCSHGRYGLGGLKSCKVCPPGTFQDLANQVECKMCRNGTYAASNGSVVCSGCSPGQFSSSSGSRSCDKCPVGFIQMFDAATLCTRRPEGTIVLNGMALVKVPLGSYVDCGVSCSFKECPAGRFGNKPPTKNCQLCPSGWSSFAGTIDCSPCAKGKFSRRDGAVCEVCLPGFFQAQSISGSNKCTACPLGYTQNKTGESSCVSLNWVYAQDCNSLQYLDDTSSERQKWACRDCLEGADCAGAVSKSKLNNLFGWWEIPENERDGRQFAECMYPPACQGAYNPSLAKRFLDEEGGDLALKGENFSHYCSVTFGFKNVSRLCHACANNYRRAGQNQCAKCPTESQNWALIFLGVVVIVCVISYIANVLIHGEGGDVEELSQSLKKIMLNYFQLLSLARAFPLRWNGAFISLFDMLGAMSTIGDHLVSLDCVNRTTSGAEIFFSKLILWMLLPLGITWVVFIFFYTKSWCHGKDFFAKRLQGEATYKDRSIVAANVALYLIYPSLCTNAFSIFSCKKIGIYEYLLIDLDQQCYVGKHLVMVFAVGLPQLLIYTLGLPVLVLMFLLRNKNKLAKKATLTRWGLYYRSYRRERFYWEIVITSRKIIVCMISILGRSMGPVRQLHTGLLVLLGYLVAEIVAQPYKEKIERSGVVQHQQHPRVNISKYHHVLKKLELTQLLVVWFTLWAGLMIYQSTNETEAGFVVFLSLIVVAMNIILVCFFVYYLCVAIAKESEVFTEELARKVSHMSNIDLNKKLKSVRSSIIAAPRKLKHATTNGVVAFRKRSFGSFHGSHGGLNFTNVIDKNEENNAESSLEMMEIHQEPMPATVNPLHILDIRDRAI